MNYTEIAQRFYKENGRAMTYNECLVHVKETHPYTFTKQVSELFAESVRLEERRKVEKCVELLEEIAKGNAHYIECGEMFADVGELLKSLKSE